MIQQFRNPPGFYFQVQGDFETVVSSFSKPCLCVYFSINISVLSFINTIVIISVIVLVLIITGIPYQCAGLYQEENMHIN